MLKAGQVQFRADKAGIIHAPIGRASFEADKLLVNVKALIEALNKAKPASSKGVYLRKLAVSSTMGPGVKVDVRDTCLIGIHFLSKELWVTVSQETVAIKDRRKVSTLK